MKIIFESELMENNKQAEVMAPDKTFEVLQSSGGDSLFFSLGTDGVFYLTRETEGTTTGWNKIDLSTALSPQHGGAKVVAKTFSVSQNASSGNIDVALAITVGATDFLYLSLGNSNNDTSWEKGVTWTAVPFDDSKNPMPVLSIADVYILQTSSGEFFAVDILKNPASANKLLFRYYLNPAGTPKWNEHDLSANLDYGSISSALGQRTGDYVAGIYTMGTILGTEELIFTPLYNAFKPGTAPTPARLTVPAGGTAMAATLSGTAATSLFVAGGGTLCYFAPNNQHDGAVATPIMQNSIFAGVQSLSAGSTASRTAVWGVNQQGELFYVACSAGDEGSPAAWSTPVPILSNVEQIASYLNIHASNNVIFAHTQGNVIVQLTQNPLTTEWQQRSALLPSTSTDDLLSYSSFTTHIQITDNNNVSSGGVAAALTSSSPVSVYVNDMYHILSPTTPLNVTADVNGVVTLVQETQSLSGVCYQLKLAATGETANINPMSKLMSTLSSINSGDDLSKVKVSNADGSQQVLVPPSVSADQSNAAAASLKQFVAISATLPPDGSKKVSSENSSAAAGLAGAGSSTQQFGVSFASSTYHQGTAAAAQLSQIASKSSSGGKNALEVAAGDVFSWLKSAFDKVESFFVTVVGDVYHFFIEIGNDLYHFLLDCVSTVVHAVELVFNKIKVFFEDLIKWLGFLFEWGDIVRTHTVIKNILNIYAAKAVAAIDTAETDVKQFFTGLEDKLNAWAGLPDDAATTVGSQAQSVNTAAGQNSPQANWGLHHTKSNASAMTTTFQQPETQTGTFQTILNDLEKMVGQEGDVFKNAFNTLKTQIADEYSSLTPVQLAKKIVAILLDVLLSTAENILVTVLDIFKAVVEGLLKVLEAPIKIPVISAVYKKVVGSDLSLLDLICLVVAIPATVIYKLAEGAAPFPANATTTSLSTAKDYAAFAGLFGVPAKPTVAVASNAVAAGAQSRSAAVPYRSAAVTLKGAPAPLRAAALEAKTAVPLSDGTIRILNIVLDSVGAFGTLLVMVFGALRSDDAANPLVDSAYAVSYLAYIAPDIPGGVGSDYDQWWTIFNDCVTGVAIVKTFADIGLNYVDGWRRMYSAWVEAGINLIWLVPDFGGYIEGSKRGEDATKAELAYNTIGYLGNAFFDLSGILAPATKVDLWGGEEDPEAVIVSKAFTIVANVFNGIYGVCMVGDAIAAGVTPA